MNWNSEKKDVGTARGALEYLIEQGERPADVPFNSTMREVPLIVGGKHLRVRCGMNATGNPDGVYQMLYLDPAKDGTLKHAGGAFRLSADEVVERLRGYASQSPESVHRVTVKEMRPALSQALMRMLIG